MSSSHDLSSPPLCPSLLGSFRKRLRNSYPHTHFFGAFFAGKIFSVVRRVENLGNPRARKNEVIPASPLDSFGENDFFPAKYLVTHTRTLPPPSASARFPPSPSPFSITWSRGRSHAFLSDKAKKKLVMAFPLFRRTFLCCSLGQTVIGEIDIERRPFPFHALTGSTIFEREV